MGFIQGYSIERVHLQFCKRLLGVQRTTQNGFVYGELGRHTFQMFRYITLVLYWIKILHTDDNKYIRKVYNMLKMICKYIQINQTGVQYSKICNVLWVCMMHGISKKLAIQTTFYILLNRDYAISLYKTGKDGYSSQTGQYFTRLYLLLSYNHTNILAMSKLRMSSHRLHIETGR